jgi:hypothetical protein
MTVNDALDALRRNVLDSDKYVAALETMTKAIADKSDYGDYDGTLYAWLEGLAFGPWDTLDELTEQWDNHVHNSLPCLREPDDDGWQCVNDHTGCVYNDGHNTCVHAHPTSLEPLEDERLSPVELYYVDGKVYLETELDE